MAPDTDVEPPEIEDRGDATLIQLIDRQEVPVPELLSWNEWQVWRREVGLRPRGRSRRAESALWKATMRELYGPDWLEAVHSKQFSLEEGREFQNPPLVRRIPPAAPPTGAGVGHLGPGDLPAFDPVPVTALAQPLSLIHI